jgi:hypothetical protein
MPKGKKHTPEQIVRHLRDAEAGLGCNDCHRTHDFQPAGPNTTSGCKASGRHDIDRAGQSPGVVHVNHLK